MFRLSRRFDKSTPMLLSLYSLSCLVGLIYFAVILATLRFMVVNFDVSGFGGLLDSLMVSLGMILVAMLVSFPFAAAICFFIVSDYRSRQSLWVEKGLRLVDQAPLLILGLIFALWVSNMGWAVFFALSFIATSKLAQRWIKLSNQVPLVYIETAQSLGLNVSQIIWTVYLKRFLKMYLGHYLAVACFLFGLTTPFLFVFSVEGPNTALFSVELFRNINGKPDYLSFMLLVLLLVHSLRLWFDSKAFFSEVENG